MRARSVRRAIGMVAVVALLFALARLLPIREYLWSMLAWVEAAGSWGPLILVLCYIVAGVLLIPTWMFSLTAGFLFGVLWGGVTASIGNTLGATAAFLVGRRWARNWVERRIAASPKFQAIDRALGRQGWRIAFLTRLSPLFPYNLLNYAFGVSRISLRSYVFASWAGMLPVSLMYVYLGTTGRSLAELARQRTERSTGQMVFLVVGLFASVAVVILITRLARRAITESVPSD